jgi:phosphoglucomutase
MPEHPVFMKTIVTIDMASRIAADYGVATVDVLTGFKFIGEQIGFLEEKGREKDYILGFEESYGYLSGSYVRDKDGVNAALLICEMFAFYKTLGKSLLDVLEELYEKYGYCLNTLHSYEFDGIEGFEKMQKIMEKLHNLDVTADLILGGRKAEAVEDYLSGRKYYCDGTTKEITGLPASDVLKFRLEGNCSLVVRPSGTEPKLKLYLSVSAKDRSLAEEAEQLLKSQMEQFFAL